MLAVLGEHHIKSKHYIFTNELIDGDSYDKRIYSSMVNLGEKMGVEILPVVLHCDNEELIKRIESKKRYQEGKITDLDFAIKRTREKRLFVPEGSLEIDNSNLSAKEVAERIVKGMNNGEKLVKTSVNNLTECTRD
ncbi:hypothetical protein [Wolbachia endosymbiont of Mansonella perstans]|uniref:hypothetical protein n=1 Tax=Wolbachia endosymbiont of Mansonella perstans TaxID=229526 RepID=UPI001CE22581|nr:hypothetical protein [Wolbachia endosymbiont of Mansonella perstans]MCA4773831.1 hypothetical protein [Wolbachia endosymbiont of Mansonella perstans]